MARIIVSREAIPQHIKTSFVNPVFDTAKDGFRSVLTIYTGQFFVGHGAGSSRSYLDVEYPVLSNFKSGIGLQPLDSMRFDGATATASPADVLIKTDPAVFQVRNVAAGLSRVTLPYRMLFGEAHASGP